MKRKILFKRIFALITAIILCMPILVPSNTLATGNDKSSEDAVSDENDNDDTVSDNTDSTDNTDNADAADKAEDNDADNEDIDNGDNENDNSDEDLADDNEDGDDDNAGEDDEDEEEIYYITVSCNGNGTVDADYDTAFFEDVINIYFTADEGCTVDSVIINGEENSDYEFASDDILGMSYVLEITVTEDVSAEITFSEIEAADEAGYEFNADEAINVCANTYIYKSGAEIVFEANDNYSAIKLNTSDGIIGSRSSRSAVLSAPVTVTEIYLLSGLKWVKGTLPANGLSFAADSSAPKISLSLDEASNGIYNDDVTVYISGSDDVNADGIYSGIQSITYYITCDKELTLNETVLYEAENAGIKQWSGKITVDADKNNSCNVIVYVSFTDMSGNKSTESLSLDIDVTSPEIKISYDNNNARNEKYFNKIRTATVVITERTAHFDANAATAGIKITAVDAQGNSVDAAYIISKWVTTKGNTDDEAMHTATIVFCEDANYTLKISYTDMAGNKNGSIDTASSVAAFEFTVDTTAPTAQITAKDNTNTATWAVLLNKLTLGLFSNKKIIVTSSQLDITSPIESVEYYKDSADKLMTKSELDLLDASKWSSFTTLTLKANQSSIVYLKVTDMAGNITYVSTGGLIADDTAPDINEPSPVVSISADSADEYYSGDVTFYINVTDPVSSGIYSGLKEVSYEVINMGSVTQSGTLFSFSKKNPSISDLYQSWSGSITVNSSINNSNDVMIVVYAVDNAGNKSQSSVSIQIDISSPVIDISYDNNSPDSLSCYNTARCATIVITERNFDANDVDISITGTNGAVPDISGWTTVSGGGNGDADTHTAKIIYSDDGDYTFKIEYTDAAGNVCTLVNFAYGTNNANEFTIDTTKPQVSISYDNNDVSRGIYFSAARCATITITEHNFDEERVNITQSASKNGSSITTPSVTWTHNNDIHTALIVYGSDGEYSLDIFVTDMAGNENDAISYGSNAAVKSFVIDTSIDSLIINGVESGCSYRDELNIYAEFSDVNLSSYELTLTRTRMNEIENDVTDDYIQSVSVDEGGGSIYLGEFENTYENDGIYTLRLSVYDKAGNKETQSITFTLNRFGSVYAYNEILTRLQDAYVQSIEEDIVITEYNPDKLIADSLQIEITRDGTLLNEAAYSVSSVANEYAASGKSGWYQYEYTIYASNFSEDGIYKISVSSKDAAGNLPESDSYDDGEILFRVDSTAAEITNITGLEEAIVNAVSVDIGFEVFDSIGLSAVNVYLDNKLVERFEGEEIEGKTSFSGDFTIKAADYEQSIRFVVTDMAGNITDTDERDDDGHYIFTPGFSFNRKLIITTSFWIRWLANKTMFWGSIATAGVLIAVIVLLIGLRKKRKGT